jgi:hypothetical protein
VSSSAQQLKNGRYINWFDLFYQNSTLGLLSLVAELLVTGATLPTFFDDITVTQSPFLIHMNG